MKCDSFGEHIERHCQACGHCINEPGHNGAHADRCGHVWIVAPVLLHETLPPIDIDKVRDAVSRGVVRSKIGG